MFLQLGSLEEEGEEVFESHGEEEEYGSPMIYLRIIDSSSPGFVNPDE